MDQPKSISGPATEQPWSSQWRGHGAAMEQPKSISGAAMEQPKIISEAAIE